MKLSTLKSDLEDVLGYDLRPILPKPNAWAAYQPAVPDLPCIKVKDIGLIGIGERDAKDLANRVIPSADIEILNSQWKTFMNKTLKLAAHEGMLLDTFYEKSKPVVKLKGLFVISSPIASQMQGSTAPLAEVSAISTEQLAVSNTDYPAKVETVPKRKSPDEAEVDLDVTNKRARLLTATRGIIFPLCDPMPNASIFIRLFVFLSGVHSGAKVVIHNGSVVKEWDMAPGTPTQPFAVAVCSEFGCRVEGLESGNLMVLHYIHVKDLKPKAVVTSDGLEKLQRILSRWRGDQYAYQDNQVLCLLGEERTTELVGNEAALLQFCTTSQMAKQFGIDVHLVDVNWALSASVQTSRVSKEDWSDQDYDADEPKDGWDYTITDDSVDVNNFRIFVEGPDDTELVETKEFSGFQVEMECIANPGTLDEDHGQIPEPLGADWDGYTVTNDFFLKCRQLGMLLTLRDVIELDGDNKVTDLQPSPIR